MTMTADERLIAYLDNELSADDRALFEADMAKDEWLAAEVAKHRGLAARIASAYAPVVDEPVPTRLKMVAKAANDRGPPRLRLPQWAAMAASLVVGIAAGASYYPIQGLVAPTPETGPLTVKDGVLTARGDLDKALSTKLAAQTGPITIGLTFKARNDRYCRTFQSNPDHLAGVACRADEHWVALTTTRFMPGAAEPDYRTAGSDMPPAILASVDALKAEDPLDAAAERAARDKGWKMDLPKAPAAPQAAPAPAQKS